MRNARGAKARCVLGATLIAFSLPAFGAQQGGAVSGIDGGALLVAGPISAINTANGFFSSMGQDIYGPPETLMSLRVGDFLMVGGRISGAGMIEADAVVQTGARYVPGATEVFVTGIPSYVDASFGMAMIGGLEVDYTPSMGRSDFQGIGAAVTVIGTQPALGGKMIGNQVHDKTELFLRD